MPHPLNAERELSAACHEWRRLAVAEGEAIRTRNWKLCSAAQSALQQLRDRITSLLPAVRAEWSRLGADGLVQRQSFLAAFRRLIELERDNQARLQTARESASAKLRQLNEARIHLKQLRRSYGSPHEPVLNSYS